MGEKISSVVVRKRENEIAIRELESKLSVLTEEKKRIDEEMLNYFLDNETSKVTTDGFTFFVTRKKYLKNLGDTADVIDRIEELFPEFVDHPRKLKEKALKEYLEEIEEQEDHELHKLIKLETTTVVTARKS